MDARRFFSVLSPLIVLIILIPGCRIGSDNSSAKDLDTVVHVRDFGVVPDAGEDAAAGISAAIEYARANGLQKVVFEPGTYTFKNLPGQDAGEWKGPYYYISLEDIHDMELLGATDEEGNPATFWLKHNDLKERQPGILKIENGSNVTVKNITVDMTPYYYSAGKVVEKDGEEVTVNILEGHPFHDEQPAFVMGTYDLEAGKTKAVRITWDMDLPLWHIEGDPGNRLMSTSHKTLSEHCEIGDGVFWFQGNNTADLLHFARIEDLLLENIHIWNGHGFPLKSEFNYNVTYRKVMLYPPGNRIATACRDGFKIFCNGGRVVMDSVYIDGCLGDDGQNIHGLWLTPEEVRGSREMVVHYPISNRPFQDLTPGRKIRLLNDDFQTGWESTITTCERLEGTRQLLTFEDELPDWIHDKTPVEAQEWLPETMLITNSVFRNTGRYGVIMKASNSVIDNCLFENNVAGIRIGGEWHPLWLESTHSENVEIRNCTFRSNNLNILYGGQKTDMAIIIKSHSMPDVKLMQNIRIHHNTFENEGICVNVTQCDGLWFWDNTIINSRQDLEIEESTTSNIHRSAPE